jgi:hypothetical protein
MHTNDQADLVMSQFIAVITVCQARRAKLACLVKIPCSEYRYEHAVNAESLAVRVVRPRNSDKVLTHRIQDPGQSVTLCSCSTLNKHAPSLDELAAVSYGAVVKISGFVP